LHNRLSDSIADQDTARVRGFNSLARIDNDYVTLVRHRRGRKAARASSGVTIKSDSISVPRSD
jgi:hypothetical protein